MIYLSTFFLSVSFATGIHTEDIPCPIGPQEDYAKIYYVLSTNEFGGYDSDGATYSSGMQYRTYAISSCTLSLFSAFTKDMKQSFSDTEKKEIHSILQTEKKQLQDPQNPTVWERYNIAAEIYRWQEKPAKFLGDLYLEAAWTVRDEAVGIHQGLHGPEVADQVLQEGKKELNKNLSNDQRKMVTYNLARVAHRNARYAQRDLYIQQFLALPYLTNDEIAAGMRFIELTSRIEPVYLRRALQEYLLHVQNAPNDGQTLYLIADIYRRLGENEKSEEYFRKANLTSDLQEEQRQIILYLSKQP